MGEHSKEIEGRTTTDIMQSVAIKESGIRVGEGNVDSNMLDGGPQKGNYTRMTISLHGKDHINRGLCGNPRQAGLHCENPNSDGCINENTQQQKRFCAAEDHSNNFCSGGP